MTDLTALHLACGAGGTTLGFEQAGIRTALAFDVDPMAVATHLVNFPAAPCQELDIGQVRVDDLPLADVWTCGIPCEPYSIAGARRENADPRDISREVARLLHAAQLCYRAPRYVFLENVRPFMHSAGAQATREALADYQVHESIWCHADFGVPQKRYRWHIIASRVPPVPVPEPTHCEHGPDLFGLAAWRTFGEIADGTESTTISAKELRYMFRHVARNADKYGNAYTPTIITPDAPLPTICSSNYKRWRSMVSIVYDEGRLRTLSLLEARRGQGFPDSFTFLGTQVEQWRLVGQAVPPPFARAVALAIREVERGR